MEHSDFSIGLEFQMNDVRYRCTDVGSRTICAIRLDAPDARWYNGPPYAVVEHCLDEDDIISCEPITDIIADEAFQA